MTTSFPFVTLPQMLVVMRVVLAIVFLAHAGVRLWSGTLERFGGFLTVQGLPFGIPLVWLITAFELFGGILFAAGYFIRWLAVGFVFILVAGIVLIHAKLGWFVGEHGTGGMEYSIVLIAALLLVAAANNDE